MRHSAFLIGIVLVPVLLLAQATVNSGSATTQPPAVPGVAPGTPLINTPIVNITKLPSPNVGASMGNVSPAGGATAPQVQVAYPYPGTVAAGGEYAVGQTPGANEPSGVSTRLPYFDRGAGQFQSVYAFSPQPQVSLGELARGWRQQHAAMNARNYSNEDIERMNQQYGAPTGGMSTTAVSAGTATSGAAPSTAPATTAQPAQAAPSQTPPPAQTTAPPPQQEPPAQPQEPAQPQTPTPQGQPQQQNPQSGTQGNLPNAASQMPTVLLLGGAAILVGLLLRRRNQRRSGAGF